MAEAAVVAAAGAVLAAAVAALPLPTSIPPMRQLPHRQLRQVGRPAGKIPNVHGRRRARPRRYRRPPGRRRLHRAGTLFHAPTSTSSQSPYSRSSRRAGRSQVFSARSAPPLSLPLGPNRQLVTRFARRSRMPPAIASHSRKQFFTRYVRSYNLSTRKQRPCQPRLWSSATGIPGTEHCAARIPSSSPAPSRLSGCGRMRR